MKNDKLRANNLLDHVLFSCAYVYSVSVIKLRNKNAC